MVRVGINPAAVAKFNCCPFKNPPKVASVADVVLIPTTIFAVSVLAAATAWTLHPTSQSPAGKFVMLVALKLTLFETEVPDVEFVGLSPTLPA